MRLRMRGLLLALGLVLTTLGFAGNAGARERPAPTAIAVADLPAEARQTLALIRHGGPFPYQRDGVVFGNYEKRLPYESRGYYHEYTVPTPGSHGRGARRIIAGEGRAGDVRRSGEYYYTDDHYRSFRRIAE
jgi:ribonuclease T1